MVILSDLHLEVDIVRVGNIMTPVIMKPGYMNANLAHSVTDFQIFLELLGGW